MQWISFKDFSGEEYVWPSHCIALMRDRRGNYYAITPELQQDVVPRSETGDVSVATCESVRLKLDPIDGARLWAALCEGDA